MCQAGKEPKVSQPKPWTSIKGGLEGGPVDRGRTTSCHKSFNERVVIMQYGNIDVYIDNSTRIKSNSNNSKESLKNRKSELEEESQDEFL
jgi:hypothetical protein